MDAFEKAIAAELAKQEVTPPATRLPISLSDYILKVISSKCAPLEHAAKVSRLSFQIAAKLLNNQFI